MPSPHPHYEFRDGCLLLRQGDGLFRIRPWPRPRSIVQLTPGSEWIPCPPPVPVLPPLRRPRRRAHPGQLELGLVLASEIDSARGKYEALRQFRSTLPPPLAKALEAFRDYQWQALLACSLSARFCDLVLSNSALAWLWLHRRTAQGFCHEERTDLLATMATHDGGTSQRELLRHLELRSTRAGIKLLRKCHLPALTAGTAPLLITILRDDRRMARLRHLPRLGKGVMTLGESTRLLRACTPALLLEVATSREELHHAPTASLLHRHFGLLGDLGMPLPRLFSSREDLRRRHHELSLRFHDLLRELQENVAPPPPVPSPIRRPVAPRPQPAPAAVPRPASRRRKSDPVLPDPPLAGNRHIVPLTTCSQLRAEGRTQSNCVASYSARVRRGTCYIYRVLWPERCTLSIVKSRDGTWKCDELKRARNARAATATHQVVKEWIRVSQEQLTAAEAPEDRLPLPEQP